VTRLLVFGLGYSARATVARMRPRLAAVWGTTRHADDSGDANSLGVTLFSFDSARADFSPSLRNILRDADHVLVSIAPDASGDPVLRHFQADLAAAQLKSLVYLSTVGVYGDHGGAWVDERSECRPASTRSRQRLAAERAWFAFSKQAGVPVAVIRLAGIYGPGRGPFEKIRSGTALRIVKPGQVFNRIHVDDIAKIVQAAFDRSAEGVFNASDEEPAPPQDVLMFAADLLSVPPPAETPFEKAELTPMARSFYSENKRVRNERIKRELGVALSYPSYREGLKAILDKESTS